jgi:hypothetical protein
MIDRLFKILFSLLLLSTVSCVKQRGSNMELNIHVAPGPKNWNSCKISDDASNLTKGGLGNEESIHGGADY